MPFDANQLYLGERGANTAQQNANTAQLNTKGTTLGADATLPGLGGLS